MDKTIAKLDQAIEYAQKAVENSGVDITKVK